MDCLRPAAANPLRSELDDATGLIRERGRGGRGCRLHARVDGDAQEVGAERAAGRRMREYEDRLHGCLNVE